MTDNNYFTGTGDTLYNLGLDPDGLTHIPQNGTVVKTTQENAGNFGYVVVALILGVALIYFLEKV